MWWGPSHLQHKLRRTACTHYAACWTVARVSWWWSELLWACCGGWWAPLPSCHTYTQYICNNNQKQKQDQLTVTFLIYFLLPTKMTNHKTTPFITHNLCVGVFIPLVWGCYARWAAFHWEHVDCSLSCGEKATETQEGANCHCWCCSAILQRVRVKITI